MKLQVQSSRSPHSRILLLAATTGYQMRSFADAARRHGISVTLATDRCHILDDPWRDAAVPVRFEEPARSAAILAALDFDGIVAVADRPTLIAALTAEKKGLPWHPPRAVAACRDKHELRQIFAAAGLLVPVHFRVPLTADAAVLAHTAPYPCVLKPLGLSASRGVIRADDANQFIAAFERIRRILLRPEIQRLKEETNTAIQIEEYIPGRELALEGIVSNGELTVLALFDKPEPLEGPFFEETIYVTPSTESAGNQQAIIDVTRRAIAATGLSHGPVHAEMRVNEQGVWMLEIAARPIGGLCARALTFQGGLTLEDAVVLHAVGKMPGVLTPASPSSGVMMIPIPRAGLYQAVKGIEDARAQPGILDVMITAKAGQKLIPLPEGATYLGFIFAAGADPAIVEHCLRRAHAALKFEILTSLDVVSS